MLRKMAAAVHLRVFSVDFATPTVFVENTRDKAGFWHSQAAPDPLFCPIAANYHQPPRWNQTAGTFYEKEQRVQDQIGEALQAFFARSIQSGRPFPVFFVPSYPSDPHGTFFYRSLTNSSQCAATEHFRGPTIQMPQNSRWASRETCIE